MSARPKANGRIPRRDRRVYMTVMVAPHTLARIKALAGHSSLSEGQIVDRGVDCLDVCGVCEGEGLVANSDNSPVDQPLYTCPACSGHRVVPRERF